MKRRLSYTLSIFITLIFVSCNPDEATIIPTDPKLDYYIESFDLEGVGFQPQMKVKYEYNDAGKISKYTVHSYNAVPGSLEELRYFVFSYVNNRVNKIAGYSAQASSPYVEYSYQYTGNDTVSKIEENNHAAGISSEANFSYDAANESVKVAYTFSNGGSFEYEFFYEGENIISDKTTRGSQVCSNGQYTYDGHINPFRNLGYVDYMLNNLSTNNKLTEAVDYLACSFPTLIPESYAYEYDERGYPTLITTFYKSGSSLTKAKKEFFYK